jgi:hypothetical protein
MEQVTLSGDSTIRIAVCNGNARTTAVKPVSITFDEFADMLSEPEIGEKDGPYYLRGGDMLEPVRGNENLKTADLLIIDGDSGFDPETGEETGAPPMNRVTAQLRKMGLKFVAHTSHSYIPGEKWKYRVAIPAKLKHEADLKACLAYVMAQPFSVFPLVGCANGDLCADCCSLANHSATHGDFCSADFHACSLAGERRL